MCISYKTTGCNQLNSLVGCRDTNSLTTIDRLACPFSHQKENLHQLDKTTVTWLASLFNLSRHPAISQSEGTTRTTKPPAVHAFNSSRSSAGRPAHLSIWQLPTRVCISYKTTGCNQLNSLVGCRDTNSLTTIDRLACPFSHQKENLHQLDKTTVTWLASLFNLSRHPAISQSEGTTRTTKPPAVFP